jgi:GAF domain-containing protein/HAMP domain-containing protein
VGEESYAVLVDENNIRLADTFTPASLYQSVDVLPASKARILKENRRLPDLPNHLLATGYPDFDRALNNYESQPFFLSNINASADGQPLDEIGAITRIQTMPWKVVYLQADFSNEALRQDQQKLTTLVTALVAMLVGLIAVAAARLLSRPIQRLTATARQISEGNLNAQAPMRSSDEFGLLGTAFNSMTGQLRASIGQLEERVQARTREIEEQNRALSHRARQLETVSDVARQVVTTQELEALLTSITHLISERFGFYHVGIFLLDDNKEYAVLRAANSEGGQRMLARRHMLPVGKVGMVGYATGAGQVRIATDVGEDSVFFNNPDLPHTRSEMVLPLIAGGETIGALDIQSTAPGAFQAEDVELFETLADQVALAINNNRLYLDTVRALKEAESLHRQYLNSEWAEDTAHRKVLGYVYNQSGIAPQKTENPLWKKVFSTGEPVYAVLPNSNGSPDRTVMAVPIAVRGETIGVIQVQDQGENRLWSDDEITVVNSIASQVAVALENARLLENTVRRAEREKKVLQITARIRSTNDPGEMMRIAVSELQQALRATRTQIYIRQPGQDGEQAPEAGEEDQRNGSTRK